MLEELHQANAHNFLHAAMVIDENQRAWDRMYDDYWMQGTPTVWIDGGWNMFRGGPTSPDDYSPLIELEGARPVPDVGLDVSMEWLGDGEIQVTVTVDATNEDACCLQRGNINRADGELPDISDLVMLVSYMFQEGIPPVCMAEADINGSGGLPDISDLIHLVSYMFQEGPLPVACP